MVGVNSPPYGHSFLSLSPVPFYDAPPLAANFFDRAARPLKDPAYARAVADQETGGSGQEASYLSSFANFSKNPDKPFAARRCHSPDLKSTYAPISTFACASGGQGHPSSSDARSIPPLISAEEAPLEEVNAIFLQMNHEYNDDSPALYTVKSAGGYDSVGCKANDGQPVEAVKQVVGHECTPQMAPQKSLRWKPKAGQSAARLPKIGLSSTTPNRCKHPEIRRHEVSRRPVEAVTAEYQCDPGVGCDMSEGFDIQEEVKDIQSSEQLSALSEANCNRLRVMEYASDNSVELAVGTTVDCDIVHPNCTKRFHHDVAVTTPLAEDELHVDLRDKPCIESAPRNLLRGNQYSGGVGNAQPKLVQQGPDSSVSSEHVAPHEKSEHLQDKQGTSVVMPSDLFCRISSDLSTVQQVQMCAASPEEQASETTIFNYSKSVAACQVQQEKPLSAEPRVYGLANEAVLHQQGRRAPTVKSNRPVAPHSYKLLALQPSHESEWSRPSNGDVLEGGHYFEGPLHEQRTQKCLSYPRLPTLHDPPYVVCQHCLQLLALPPNLSMLTTKNIQKLRCSGCMKVSLFTVELAVPSGASSGTLADISYQHEKRIYAASLPHEPSAVMDESTAGKGRNSTVNSPSKELVTSLGIDSGVVCLGQDFSTGVPVSLMSVPLSSPPPGAASNSSGTATAENEGKDMPTDFGEPFDKLGSHSGPELPLDSGAARSMHGKSESESDFAGDGSFPGSSTMNSPLDDLSGSNDEYDTQFSSPSLSTTAQDGLRGRNKVVSIFKGLKDFTKTGQGKIYRRQVYVNSRAIPDPLVKKAEEYAGPIHPGHYW